MHRTLPEVVLLILLLLVSYASAYAQNNEVLTLEEYIDIVIYEHPVSKIANLRDQMAQAETLFARGEFDPFFYSTWDHKEFEDKQYYKIFDSKLTIPVSDFGVDVVAGYENTNGDFINPENNTTNSGLWNVGIEANLIQGLFVNERNTAKKQAKVFQNLAENEKQNIRNDLIYDACGVYLGWQQYYEAGLIIQQSIELATAYFENTKQSYFGGEKTAMDTLEAYVLMQDQINLLSVNNQYLTAYKRLVENYLWLDDRPVLINENTIPQTFEQSSLKNKSLTAIDDNSPDQHPLIQEKLNKYKIEELTLRLKQEKLKPKLKAKFNPLLATTENNIIPRYSPSDYKYGLDFSLPLFFRSERANVLTSKIKLEEIQNEMLFKQQEIQNQINNSRRQISLLYDQINIQVNNIELYRTLLEAENTKFTYGESSMFLLNKRQEKYVNSQIKLIKLHYQLSKEYLSLLYYQNDLD